MKFSRIKRMGIVLILIPLAGIVAIVQWANKIFGKPKGHFSVNEAQADASCWIPPTGGGIGGIK